MKQTIEKNVVSISVGTAMTVVISVAIMVWNIADMKANFSTIISDYNTRLTVMEKVSETQQNYLYNLKSDLKADIEKNNKKLDDIYNLLIKIK